MAVKRFKFSLISQGKSYGVLSGRSNLTPNATGGSISNAGGYKIHLFNSVGSNIFQIFSSFSSTIEYLIVAGGGSGGDVRAFTGTPAGGGGAGGILSGSIENIQTMSYSLFVGSGGSVPNQATFGGNGQNSTGFNLVAIGGGGGGGGDNPNNSSRSGRSGGSGGGGTSDIGVGGAGNLIQGKNGANGVSVGAGGGGGASSVGLTSTSNASGGSGQSSSISGSSIVYAVGGNGGVGSAGSIGSNGQSGRGNGGQGGGFSNGVPGSGGSGVIVIRYLAPNYQYD
jgi:hypothetical protein